MTLTGRQVAVSTETAQDTSCAAQKTHPQGDTCDPSDQEVPATPQAGGARGGEQGHGFLELAGGRAGQAVAEMQTRFLGPTDPSLGGSSLAK